MMDTTINNEVLGESNDQVAVSVDSSEDFDVKKIELPLLVIAKYLQCQNGLKHKDFAQYTRYCSRKLHRLRSGLKMKCGRNKFQKSYLEPGDYTSHKHLLVLILLIERSWSAGTEIGSRLANSTNAQQNSSNNRARFHEIRKLRRGCNLSKLLIEVARKRCTTRSIVEVQAYQSYILGNYYLKCSNWEKGAVELNKSLKLYNQLKLDTCLFETPSIFSHFNIPKLLKTECIKIYEDRIVEMTPLIRLCMYHCKRLNILVPDFDVVNDLKLGDSPVSNSNMKFFHNNKEHCVPIPSLEMPLVELHESYKVVKESIDLGDIEKILKLSSNTVIECFSETLLCSSTLKNRIHEEMAKASVNDEASLTNGLQSHDWIAFESYTRNFNLFVSIERDLIFTFQLIEYFNKPEFYTRLILLDDENWRNMSQELQNSLSKRSSPLRHPEEGVRICDILNFTISEITSNSKTEFTASLTEILSMVVSNCRSLFLSHCFGQKGKIQEAFVLCDLVKSRIEIEANLDKIHLDRDGIFQRITTLIQGINSIVGEMATKSYNIYLSNVAVQAPLQNKVSATKGINGILDEETLNPKILPIPVKPIMFDIASDFISPPDLSNKIKKSGLAKMFSKATSKLGLFK